jgi:hypothetical protein
MLLQSLVTLAALAVRATAQDPTATSYSTSTSATTTATGVTTHTIAVGAVSLPEDKKEIHLRPDYRSCSLTRDIGRLQIQPSGG